MKLTEEQRIFLDGSFWAVVVMGIILLLAMLSGCATKPTRAHINDREFRMRLKNFDHRYQS